VGKQKHNVQKPIFRSNDIPLEKRACLIMISLSVHKKNSFMVSMRSLDQWTRAGYTVPDGF